jgi:sterol desaturase/sphingolipid hydroxylase (fatty acid hydroxylase superfamily)
MNCRMRNGRGSPSCCRVNKAIAGAPQIVFGWALLSYEMLSRTIVDQLTALLMPPAPLPALVSRTVITVMLFLAYELGYWLNHYLSHRIPFL